MLSSPGQVSCRQILLFATFLTLVCRLSRLYALDLELNIPESYVVYPIILHSLNVSVDCIALFRASPFSLRAPVSLLPSGCVHSRAVSIYTLVSMRRAD
uniref:Uncharacterized protein n=1 Tax=Anopheles darlingi TaxID=43151 RepID=A0A2M4DI52_ANODA